MLCRSSEISCGRFELLVNARNGGEVAAVRYCRLERADREERGSSIK